MFTHPPPMALLYQSTSPYKYDRYLLILYSPFDWMPSASTQLGLADESRNFLLCHSCRDNLCREAPGHFISRHRRDLARKKEGCTARVSSHVRYYRKKKRCTDFSSIDEHAKNLSSFPLGTSRAFYLLCNSMLVSPDFRRAVGRHYDTMQRDFTLDFAII